MNFGSILGGLSRWVPGYIQGQRQAVQDNWADLMNYNKTQMGQLENAFTEATFGPRLDMFHNAVRNDDINTAMNGLNFGLFMTEYPARLTASQYYQQYYPQMLPYQWGNMFNMWQNPMAGMMPMMGNMTASTPSGLGR